MQCLDRFAVLKIFCLDIPESEFAVLWTLFTSGYSVWMYQRVDLLHLGHCPYFGADPIVVQLSA